MDEYNGWWCYQDGILDGDRSTQGWGHGDGFDFSFWDGDGCGGGLGLGFGSAGGGGSSYSDVHEDGAMFRYKGLN